MSDLHPDQYNIAGKKLDCPICNHDRFTIRHALLNTRATTFLGFDFLNKKADNYVCQKCGHIMWFLPPER